MTRLLELPARYSRPPSESEPRKYRNEPTTYGGIRYDSKREADFARELDLAMHARGTDRVESWERQIQIPLQADSQTVGHIVVDFLVRYADGRRELVEIKSPATMTPLFKFKLKFLRATFLRDHPDINFRIQT